MISTAFDYQRANTVEEAISLLQNSKGKTKLLAGGHSLLPAMKLRLNSPDTLIDISRIASMQGVREENGDIIIGSMTTHYDVANDSILQKKLPAICEVASLIGDIQVRNKGTIGGSLAHADPAADWPAIILALDAKMHVQGPDGNRMIDAADFFNGFYMTDLGEHEILVDIHIPAAAANAKATYQKFPQPASRYALVGCAVCLSMDGDRVSDCRIAFTGVASEPFRDEGAEAHLKGQSLDEATIEKAAKHAAEGQYIMSDHFASEEYRHHLARVFLKRALQALSK